MNTPEEARKLIADELIEICAFVDDKLRGLPLATKVVIMSQLVTIHSQVIENINDMIRDEQARLN